MLKKALLLYALALTCACFPTKKQKKIKHPSAQCIQKVQERYLYIENCEEWKQIPPSDGQTILPP
jgi:hypothetical protein